jgi:hypothetical protein
MGNNLLLPHPPTPRIRLPNKVAEQCGVILDDCRKVFFEEKGFANSMFRQDGLQNVYNCENTARIVYINLKKGKELSMVSSVRGESGRASH